MGTTANAAQRETWNKGKIVGQKAPFKVKDIWALCVLASVDQAGRAQAGALPVPESAARVSSFGDETVRSDPRALGRRAGPGARQLRDALIATD